MQIKVKMHVKIRGISDFKIKLRHKQIALEIGNTECTL